MTQGGGRGAGDRESAQQGVSSGMGTFGIRSKSQP